jgi:selenium-binding protein 1
VETGSHVLSLPARRRRRTASRDGKRVYVTNSLYGAWDDQFYPDGVGAWMAKLDSGETFEFDERFFPHGDEFRGLRPHQTRLQGGDASSDSYCYP